MVRIIFLAILSLAVYTSNIWGTSIYILDEAKNASCALEMLQRSEFITPTFNGELRTDKPPLHYYFMMLAYSLFGANAFAARLFSALAGVVLVLYLYKKVSGFTNEATGFFSALITLASFQLTVQFHMAVPDPYLMLWLTISFVSFYELQSGQPKAFYPFYISMALGFLTKGLIAVVFPGLVALLYLVYARSLNRETLKRIQFFKGAVLFLVIALPWYITVGFATHGEWLTGFFLNHNLNRYTSAMEGHQGFFWLPTVFLLSASFPFSVFFLKGLALTWKHKADVPFVFYCLMIVTVIVFFFSFSQTLLPGYIGPAIPFMAVLLGYALASGRIESDRVEILVIISLLVSLAIPFAVYYLVTHDEQVSHLSWYATVFTIPLITLLIGWLFKRYSIRHMVISWSGGWIITAMLFFYILYPKLDALNPVRASRAVRDQFPHHEMIGYRIFNPAFVFEKGGPITRMHTSNELKSYLIQKDRKVLVITRSKYLEEVMEEGRFTVVFRARDLFEKTETVLLAN